MKNSEDILPKPFSNMLENYNLCKKTRPSGYTSSFWDVFPEDYEKSISQIDAWNTFLRNPLSLGFNDVLIDFDNARRSSSEIITSRLSILRCMSRCNRPPVRSQSINTIGGESKFSTIQISDWVRLASVYDANGITH